MTYTLKTTKTFDDWLGVVCNSNPPRCGLRSAVAHQTTPVGEGRGGGSKQAALATVYKTNCKHALKSLKDKPGKNAISQRLDRARESNLGDHKSVGDGISEMRIHVGAGYRLYYTTAGKSSSCW